jgi:hypothetical protein
MISMSSTTSLIIDGRGKDMKISYATKIRMYGYGNPKMPARCCINANMDLEVTLITFIVEIQMEKSHG